MHIPYTMTELPISMSERETLRSESHILESVGDGNSRDSAHADVGSGTQLPPVGTRATFFVAGRVDVWIRGSITHSRVGEVFGSSSGIVGKLCHSIESLNSIHAEAWIHDAASFARLHPASAELSQLERLIFISMLP